MDWDEQHAERRSSEELLAEHRRLLESREGATLTRENGDVAAALTTASDVVDAIYELPYLAHAPMEPNNAACRMGDDGVLEVWAGTEGPEYSRMAAAAAAGIEKDRIRVHVPFAGGSFGLHSSAGHDPTSEAVSGRAGTPNSPTNPRSTSSPSPPGATRWTYAAICWPTTHAP